MVQFISTNLEKQPYNIYIGDPLFSSLRPVEILADEHITASSWMIVTDTNVASLYHTKLSQIFCNAYWAVIPYGEKSKTLEMLSFLYNEFWKAKLDRKSIILALGGGVVGDIAGFAAATYMRGLGLVHIPTTLLAMIDASIGGKVAINLPQGKNLVGCFKQPLAVLIGYEMLNTLPEEEWRCGMAEVIKHGILGNPKLLEIQSRSDFTPEFLKDAIQVKLKIVEQDPTENNIRVYLNLGHTFAHALEQASDYTLKHGEAVSLGMIAASRLSAKLGLCKKIIPERVQQILYHLHLPTYLPYINTRACYTAMESDKKRATHHLRFILLHDFGHPVIVEDIPSGVIMEILESLKEDICI